MVRSGWLATIAVFCLGACGWCAVALAEAAPTGSAPWEVVDQVQHEIDTWKEGDEVPRRLLSFPTGNVREREVCNIGAEIWSPDQLISKIENDALLREILFDPRADNLAFQSAAARIVERKGVPGLSRILDEHDNAWWELDLLQEALRLPAARMEVALIEKAAMSTQRAESAFMELKKHLESGKSWKEAYAAVADANPESGSGPGTLVGYELSGWISSGGFSFTDMERKTDVPAAYVKEIVNRPPGDYVLQKAEGTYFFHVTETWPGSR